MYATLAACVVLFSCSGNNKPEPGASGQTSNSSSIPSSSDKSSFAPGAATTAGSCTVGACCDRFGHVRTSEMICDFVKGSKCDGINPSCPSGNPQLSLPAGKQYFALNDGASQCAANDSSPIAPPPPLTGGDNPPAPVAGSWDSAYVTRDGFSAKGLPGTIRTFNVYFKNTGNSPWQYSDTIFLGGGMYDFATGNLLGLRSIPLLPGEVIGKGQTKAFEVSLQMPQQVGTYQYYFKMFKYDGSCMFLNVADPLYCNPYFGQYSDTITVITYLPPPPPPDTCDPNGGICGVEGEKEGPRGQ